jgi:predicted MPP superfamily phosphohydrolase
MEAQRRRFTRGGVRRSSAVSPVVKLAEPLLQLLGWYRQGIRNSLTLGLSEIELFFADLPPAFDGYSILHFTDLHVRRLPRLMDRIIDRVRDVEADLAVITGDFQTRGWPSPAEVAADAGRLASALATRDGVLGVLGNHDHHQIVEPLEAAGVRLLLNEHITIARGDGTIGITGLDDVNRFYTPEAERALRSRQPGRFSLALVHSVEMADVAAEAGHALYLSGHTHGGQICLPGGRPLFTALDSHRQLAAGQWQWDRMLGYTSRGVGVGQRARFNCPPEIALLRLRCEPIPALPT